MSTAAEPRQRRPRAKLQSDRIDFDSPPPFSVRRFTVDEYHKLIDAGFFAENECFELLDGLIVPKTTRKPPHDLCIDLLTDLFGRILPAGWRPRIQCAITLSASEPEPDCCIVRGLPREYLEHHPGPAEIAVVIEVSDTTLARDHYKACLYARDRIPRYWLINLVDRVIEDHSVPTGQGDTAHYKSVKAIALDGHLSLELSGKSLEVAVEDILP